MLSRVAEIPESRKLEIELPSDVPVGPAEVVIVIGPVTKEQDTAHGQLYRWMDLAEELGFEAGQAGLSENIDAFTGRRF